MKSGNLKIIYLESTDNKCSLLLDRVEIADTFFKRMRGLLCGDGFNTINGLVITPCNYVHTFGMKYDIDIVFLDKDGRVVECRHNVAKNTIAGVLRAKHTLELPAGILLSLKINVGDKVGW